MKIEIVVPPEKERKHTLRAGQVYRHNDNTLYLVVSADEGWDMVELNKARRYAGRAGRGMSGNDYAFTYVGMLKITP